MRATGLKGDAESEIIEILDDETDAFGDRASTVSHDSGGPRWVGPVAAVALVGIIGFGIATSASSNSAPKVAPVTSTTVHAPASSTVPTSTVPTPIRAEPQPVVPYYAVDPPRQFIVQGADLVQVGSYPSQDAYQLWATDGATSTTGSWFSIEAMVTGPESFTAVGARRVQVGDRSFAISHPSSGRSMAQFAISASLAVTLTAVGWSDDDLLRLAQSIVPDEDKTDAATLSDPTLTTGYQMLTTVQPWSAVQGNPAEQVYYSSISDSDSAIVLLISQQPPATAEADAADRQVGLRFLLDHLTPFTVDGRSGVAGNVADESGYATANWSVGDHVLTLSGQMTVGEIIALAGTVHEVSSEEWNGMQFQATAHNTANNGIQYDQGTPTPVSFGIDSASKPWTIQVSMQTYGKRRDLFWQWDTDGYVSGSGSPVDDTAKISTAVDAHRTYVVADLPRAIAPTAQLLVLRDGLDPVMIPFNDIDPTFDRTFAAYAFSEPGGYSAQIVGADGTVLATWPES